MNWLLINEFAILIMPITNNWHLPGAIYEYSRYGRTMGR